jgi:hypothetical protein
MHRTILLLPRLRDDIVTQDCVGWKQHRYSSASSISKVTSGSRAWYRNCQGGCFWARASFSAPPASRVCSTHRQVHDANPGSKQSRTPRSHSGSITLAGPLAPAHPAKREIDTVDDLYPGRQSLFGGTVDLGLEIVSWETSSEYSPGGRIGSTTTGAGSGFAVATSAEAGASGEGSFVL